MPEFVQGLLAGIAVTALGVLLIWWLVRDPGSRR